MRRENDSQVCNATAVRFRLKPYLQAGGVHACALPHALWYFVNKDCDFFNLFIASSVGSGGARGDTVPTIHYLAGQGCTKFLTF